MNRHSRTTAKRAPSRVVKPHNLKQVFSKKVILHFIKTHRKQIYWAIGIIIAIILLIPVFTYIYFAGDLKDKNSITNRSRTGLTLMDQDGETFFTFYQPKEVTYVNLDQMPIVAQQAAVAAEDKNFYTNPGFSITGMGRAFLRNLMAGEVVEGGSTISQELVKNALLNSSRNYFRKYQELVLATELNRRFSKQDILEMYLNSVYFGEGAFGIENAAKAYFGIPAKELTLSQSALLIGILPAPSAYSPLSNDPKYAKAKQKQVLGEMVEEKYITKAQADAAAAEDLEFNPTAINDTNTLAPHFALYVKNYLIKKYGEERVIREGFRVTTTLNSKWQTNAERVVKNRIQGLARNNAGNAAAIAIDPKTGDIKVMVGSYDWEDERWGKENMTLVPRQPGSSFKPLMYAQALEDKLITPATVLHDIPTSFGSYKPLNYDKRFRGDVTVRRALANSLNIPAVEVMNKLGVSDGLKAARNFGITSLDSKIDYGLPLVLGSGEVPLIQMTDAYAVFASQGIYHEPNAILEIKNKYDKQIDTQKKTFWDLINPAKLFEAITKPQEKRVLSQNTSFLISSILSDNKARAEVFGGSLTLSRPAAVKTGTTNDYKDALTIGYTPSIVVGVWVGNNDNTPMDSIAGSSGAGPIWRGIMENIFIGTKVEQFTKPYSIVEMTVCPNRKSDEPISSSSAFKEYFLPGTEPDSCEEPSPTFAPTSTPQPTEGAKPTDTPAPTPTQAELPTPTPQTVVPTTPLLSPTSILPL